MAFNNDRFWEAGTTGAFGTPMEKEIPKFRVVGDRVEENHKVIVHRFRLGDVEDPDLYAAQPLFEWKESEVGQWVMSHSLDVPVWHRYASPVNYDYQYVITAILSGKDYTFWQLKWANQVDKL